MKIYTNKELLQIYGTDNVEIINAGKEANERVCRAETIKKEEWKNLHKDYKTIVNKQHYILKLTEKGTCLIPVKIV